MAANQPIIERYPDKRCVVVEVCRSNTHPQADHLRIIMVTDGKDFMKQCVVGDHYRVGERGVFIPPSAMLPRDVLDEMWLSGKLNGPQRNRVVTKQMKGIQSDGLFYGGSYGKRWRPEWQLGADVSAAMGVVYDPRF